MKILSSFLGLQAEYHDHLLRVSCPEELKSQLQVDADTDVNKTGFSGGDSVAGILPVLEHSNPTLGTSASQEVSLPSTDGMSDSKQHKSANSGADSNNSLKLDEQEVEIMRWARNSGGLTIPKGQDNLVYKKATALEALVGGRSLMRHAMWLTELGIHS